MNAELWPLILAAVMAAPLVIEVAGYFWHRFVEHHGAFGPVFLFRHWQHHEVEYPIDQLRSPHYRDANSWTWYVLLTGIFSAQFALLPWPLALAMSLSGFIYGWCVIGVVHSAFHVDGHWLNRFAWFRRLVRLHDIHHWTPANYGILFFGMDRLFGTLREDFPAAKEPIFPAAAR